MADDLVPLKAAEFAEPLGQLEKLLSQPNRAFLLGAGCSKCAGLPLMAELTDQVLDDKCVSEQTKGILHAIRQAFDGATSITIEDCLSELVDVLSIAERRQTLGATDCRAQVHSLSIQLEDARNAVSDIRDAIVRAIDREDLKVEVHRDFVRAIHRSLQSGKAGDKHPVDYFILNYDTLVEDALGRERLTVADGFSAGATAWWNQESFNTPGVAARVFKIHGSIDWLCLEGNDILPHRIRTSRSDGRYPGKRVVIWPAATKYRETQRDPYAQVLAFMRSTLRPQPKSELVLAICGYRFSDSHINLELEQALHESQGRLTIVAFSEQHELTGQLADWLRDPAVREQVLVYTSRGFIHGSKSVPSLTDLPWWKFEVLTRLLGGER